MKLFSFEDWELTQDTLRDVLNYNPKTGEFYWLVKPASRVHIGDRAGSVETVRGYRVIGLAGKLYKAHRLAWLYVYGNTPAFGLDHINRKPLDNRICNLREATKSQNGGNAIGRRDGRLKGAYWHSGDQRWYSSLDGEWLGYYPSEKTAHAAYCKAAKIKYGEFFNAG
jgi:hypothetical protein